MFEQYEKIFTRKILIEKYSNSDNQLYIYTVPVPNRKNAVELQLKQGQIGIVLASELELIPVIVKESYSTFDEDNLFQIGLLNLLKQQQTQRNVKNLFVRDVHLVSKNEFYCAMILHWLWKNGTKIFDEHGIVTIDNLYSPIFGTLSFLNDYEDFLETISANKSHD